MTSPSEEALAELERLDKRRQTPWEAHVYAKPTDERWPAFGFAAFVSEGDGGPDTSVVCECVDTKHAAFIAALANAFPSLISELRSLREREAEFKSRCDSADALLAAAKNFAGGWYFESVDPKCVTEAEAIEGEINAFFAYAPDPRSQDTGETG